LAYQTLKYISVFARRWARRCRLLDRRATV